MSLLQISITWSSCPLTFCHHNDLCVPLLPIIPYNVFVSCFSSQSLLLYLVSLSRHPCLAVSSQFSLSMLFLCLRLYPSLCLPNPVPTSFPMSSCLHFSSSSQHYSLHPALFMSFPISSSHVSLCRPPTLCRSPLPRPLFTISLTLLSLPFPVMPFILFGYLLHSHEWDGQHQESNKHFRSAKIYTLCRSTML